MCAITGIPISNVQEKEGQKLLRMEETLAESVIGQEEGIGVVSTAVRRNRALLLRVVGLRNAAGRYRLNAHRHGGQRRFAPC